MNDPYNPRRACSDRDGELSTVFLLSKDETQISKKNQHSLGQGKGVPLSSKVSWSRKVCHLK